MGKEADILDSLVEVTKNKDIELLEISLATTIYELFKVLKVSFFRTYHDKLQIHSIISVSEAGISVIDNNKELDEEVKDYLTNFEQLRTKMNTIRFSVDENEIMIHPIILKSSVIGFLSIIMKKGNRIDDKIINGFLKVYHNYHSLLIESQHDKLTGLLNRKAFEERLFNHINLQKQQDSLPEQPIAKNSIKTDTYTYYLAIFDIDNFKQINDKYGHVYGDDVLILIAMVMRKTFRLEDILLRYGGEEFIAVIKVLEKDEAVKRFEQFRYNIENNDFGIAGTITISIGVVSVNPNENITTMVGHADQALYIAKKNGKNQICFYEDLIKQGIIKSEITYGDIFLFND